MSTAWQIPDTFQIIAISLKIIKPLALRRIRGGYPN
jgi:hypothetical protein